MPTAPSGASSWEVQQSEVPIPALQPTQSPAHIRFAPIPTILPAAGSNTQTQILASNVPVAPQLSGSHPAGFMNGSPHANSRQQPQPVSAPVIQNNAPTPAPKVAPASKTLAPADDWGTWGAAPTASTWGNEKSNWQSSTQW
jgi:hypothetical protein